MNKTSVVTLTLLTFASAAGCAEVGNFFVPPHPNSDFGDPSKACLYLTPEPKPATEMPAIGGVVATAAIGYLIDRTAAAIKDEAKRYQSSYSARETNVLGNTEAEQWKQLTFVRYLGEKAATKKCKELDPANTELEKAVQLEAELTTGQTPEIRVTKLTLNKTKAKVASVRWFVPWSWWMLLDRSSQKVDLKATVVMSAIVKTDKGSQSKDIVSADLPLGKHNLDDKNIGSALPINDVSSGPFVLPQSESGLRTTVTITVTESNELGDTIGDAAKKVSDNKQAITNFVLGELKIAPPKDK